MPAGVCTDPVTKGCSRPGRPDRAFRFEPQQEGPGAAFGIPVPVNNALISGSIPEQQSGFSLPDI